MRRLAVLAGILAAALWGVAGASAGVGDSRNVMIADLAGANQPTPVTTDATGFASFTISGDETSIDYRLYVNDAVGVTQAHIHLAPVGENGPVAAFLFGFVSPGMDSDGLLAEGTLTAADLIASTGFDGSMGQLLDRLRAGTAYVNVHTAANPPGEIRGQIGPRRSTSDRRSRVTRSSRRSSPTGPASRPWPRTARRPRSTSSCSPTGSRT